MPYQPHRGNPETKQYFVVNNLIGGMNTLSADDVISTIEAREVLNMHLSGSGSLVKRKGFGYSEILNNWLAELSPTYLPDGDIYFIKVIKNEGNISKYIEEFESWTEFRNFIRTRAYTFTLIIGYAAGDADELGARDFKIDIIQFINDEATSIISGGAFTSTVTDFSSILNGGEDGGFTDFITNEYDGGIFSSNSGVSNLITLPAVIPAEQNITNIDIVSFLGKHYLLLDQLSPSLNGLLQIDEVELDTYETKIISATNLDNLYKPSPIDLSETNTLGGYNMLYNPPKDFVKNHTSIRALHGIYITDPVNNDLYEDFSIPKDGDFRLNVLFSGSGIDINSFEFDFFSEDAFGNRTSIPYLAGFDPYSDSQTFLDDAIASYRIKLDLENLPDEINTITVNVDLIKEEEAIIPVRQFSSEIALAEFFSKDYYLISTETIQTTVREQGVHDVYHLLKERNATSYNFIDREMVVYRPDTTLLHNFSRVDLDVNDLYVYKDDNKIYKMVNRTIESSNEATYNATTKQYRPSIVVLENETDLVDYTDTVNAFFNQKEYGYILRADTIIRLRIFDQEGGQQSVLADKYFSINDTSDELIGTITHEDYYTQEADIVDNAVLQVSTISKVIPKLTISEDEDSGEIYSINDRQVVADITKYYKYNGNTQVGFTDFDFYISESDTVISRNVEYPVIDSVTAPVRGISFDNARILEIDGRLVAYGGNTIWFSDFRRFNYFPSNTYFNLSLSSDDEITSINYFRGSYIIFTRNTIWKMRGNLDQGNISFQILNDSIGCIAPKSVRPFNNTLVFMSRDGLYRIKQNFYLDGLENVDKIDKRIVGVLPGAVSDYESILYDEQYILFIKNGSEYDALRYYYNVNLGTSGSPFVVDTYAQKPEHIFDVAGKLYAIKDRRFWIYDETFTDFLPTYTAYTEQDEIDATYRTRLKLPAFSFGYATHEKKFKNIFMKTTTGETMPLYLTIKIDGYDYASPYNFNVFRDGDGIINYEFTLESESTSLGSFVVGDHQVGASDTNQHKVVVGGKGKNIMLIIEQESTNYFGISNIGYLFKLGKVRGDI